MKTQALRGNSGAIIFFTICSFNTDLKTYNIYRLFTKMLCLKNKQALALTLKDSGMPTGTNKLLKQYILSLKRTGNARSSGSEGITSTFHFTLQENATRENTCREKKKRKSNAWRPGKGQCSSPFKVLVWTLPSVTDVKAARVMHSLRFGCFLSSNIHFHVAVRSAKIQVGDSPPGYELCSLIWIWSS